MQTSSFKDFCYLLNKAQSAMEKFMKNFDN